MAVRTRKDVWKLAEWDPILLWYAKAVAQMQAMVGVTAVGCIERSQRRPNQLLLCSIIAAIGLTCLILPR